MEWHKVEDYPVGSNEFVLVSTNHHTRAGCVVAKLVDGPWEKLQDNGLGVRISVLPTDRWCHITLPED